MVNAALYQISEADLKRVPIKVREYEGMVPKRWTTDVLFLILLIGAWAGMTYIGYEGSCVFINCARFELKLFYVNCTVGIQNGNPYRLIAPVEDTGRVCGYDPKTAGKYLYSVTTFGIGVCVESCPSTSAFANTTNLDDIYCLAVVPTDPTQRLEYYRNICMANGQYSASPACLCNYRRATSDILFRCIFSNHNTQIDYKSASAPSYFQTFIADLFTAKGVVFGFGVVMAMGLSFIWSHLLQIPWLGYFITWIGLVGTAAIMVIAALIAQMKANEWQAESPPIHSVEERQAMQAFFYLLLIATFFFLCFMVYLRKQIHVSIELLSITAHCVNEMKFIVFTPFINLMSLGLFMIPWVAYTLFTASQGDLVPQIVDSTRVGYKFQPDRSVVGRLWFLFFVFVWTMGAIRAVTSIATSISVAKWYFSEKKNIFHVNSLTILFSYCIALRFHVGTAAFGSLIVALIQLLRTILLSIKKKYDANCTSKLALFFCCWLQCCLWGFESFMKYVSSNAYTQTAIHVSEHNVPPPICG